MQRGNLTPLIRVRRKLGIVIPFGEKIEHREPLWYAEVCSIVKEHGFTEPVTVFVDKYGDFFITAKEAGV